MRILVATVPAVCVGWLCLPCACIYVGFEEWVLRFEEWVNRILGFPDAGASRKAKDCTPDKSTPQEWMWILVALPNGCSAALSHVQWHFPTYCHFSGGCPPQHSVACPEILCDRPRAVAPLPWAAARCAAAGPRPCSWPGRVCSYHIHDYHHYVHYYYYY